MIEITKKITYVFILMFSFIFSQCDEYSNESECSSNSSSCYWESDLTNYNCTQFNSSSACSQYADYGCSWEFSWGGWMNHGSSCVGGGFQVDNGTCQEVEMPECSGMEEVECDTYSDCNWIEDYEWSNCSSYDSAAECSWANDNGGNCDWSWNSTEWQDTCSGGSFQLDNSYCEESEETFDQCSDLDTEAYCYHSSIYDLDCMWVDEECIDYEEPPLECSEMNQSECDEDNMCDWVVGSIDCESFSSSNSCSSNNCDWNVDITYGNCWELSVNECYNYPNQCYVDSQPGWYDSSGPYCTGGTYQIDSSYCGGQSGTCEDSLISGDVNGDYVINVQDIVQIVNLIFNEEYNPAADIDNNSTVDVLDIIQLVNIILN